MGGAGHEGNKDGGRGYEEGVQDQAASGHGGVLVFSVIYCCVTNRPSGLRQQIIPSHGSEGSRAQP